MKLNVGYALRCIRGCWRLLTSIVESLRCKLSLILNNIKHGKLNIRGIPYFAVAPNAICIIGNNVTLNNGLRHNPIGYPQPCSIVVASNAKLTIGNNVGISQASIICHHSITIGDNVKIGGGVKSYDTNFHSLNPEVRRVKELDMQEKKCRPVVIEHDAFIGAGSIVLSGVTIGENSIVAAGSVVCKSIPANEIWGGNPARYIKKI